MNESDGRTAVIEWLENEYAGWTVEPSGKPEGIGECFKLHDSQGESPHILGITRELLLESNSREELWQHLQTHNIKKRLATAGTQIVWLGTGGYLED